MWIESELARKLSRVEAPEELWDRTLADARGSGTPVQNRDRKGAAVPWERTLANARGSVPTRYRAWALVAAVLFVALVWGFPSRRDLVIRSASATQIREWVKANAGFDIPLLADSSGVRLTGARVSHGGVEIACRVGNHDAKLSISKNKSSLQHAALNANSSAISWGMNNRLYTLACATPEDLRIACLLCHSNSERRMALN